MARLGFASQAAFRPTVSDDKPSPLRESGAPSGSVPTNALKLYRPQGHTFEISVKLVPLNTLFPLRSNEKDCLPTCISTWKAVAPAGALNFCVFFPEVTHSASPRQHRNYEYSIGHRFRAIGTSLEIVSRIIIRRSHSGIGRIAVDTLESGSIPINKLVFRNVGVWRFGARFIRCDVGFRHVKPAIVWPN